MLISWLLYYFEAMNMKDFQNYFPPTNIIFLIFLIPIPGTYPVDFIQESKQSLSQQCQYSRKDKSSHFKQEKTCLLRRRDEITQQQLCSS